MGFASAGDLSIHYVERGSGAPLVLLPGLGCTHEIWSPQLEYFASGHRVIAIEPRGGGASSRLTGWRHILSRQAGDVAAVVDQLGLERVVICGVSYGGVLAQRFALDFPDRIAGLVTVDSFSATRPRSVTEAVNLALLYATGWLWLFPRLMRAGVHRQYARWPDAQRYMLSMLRDMRRWETVKIRYALNHVDYTEELRSLACPALSIAADWPQLVSLSRRTIDAIPGARMEVMQDSFDPSNRCRPQEFNRLLGAYLRELAW